MQPAGIAAVDDTVGGILRTPIDPAGISAPYARSLIDRLQHGDVTLELFTVDSHFRATVCLAYLWSEDYPAWFAGSGCHLDPHIALTRAITEAAQSRLTCIAGTRDDLPSHEEDLFANPPASTEPSQRHALDRHWGHRLKTGPTLRTDTFADVVGNLAASIEQHTGHEPIAVTLSGPDDPITAVKVVAPGTRSRTQRDIPRW